MNDRNMQMVSAVFAIVVLLTMCLSILCLLPSKGMGFIMFRPKPMLDLPVASRAMKTHARGTVQLSLNRRQEWVNGRHKVDDLGKHLADLGELVRDHGREPSLRLRIDKDAPARYFVNAVTLAEELDYSNLFVAVYGPG